MRSCVSDSCFSQGSEKFPNARPCGDIIYSSNRSSLLSLRRKDTVNDDSNLIYLYFSGRVSREVSCRGELQEPIVLGGGLAFPWMGVLLFPPSFFGVATSLPKLRLPRGGGWGRGTNGPRGGLFFLPARPRWRGGWSGGAGRPVQSSARAGRAAGRRAAGSPCVGRAPKAGGANPDACGATPSPGFASVLAILGAGAAAGHGGG